MFGLRLFVGLTLWLIVCLSWKLLFTAALVCTTADRAPHVCAATKLSSTVSVNRGRCGSCVPSDVVTAASLARSKVPVRWRLGELRGIEHGHKAPSGRTDTICDSELDLFYLYVDVDGHYCSCAPGESFQPRQILDQLTFSDGWIPRMCFRRNAWLAVRAVAPHEARIIALQKTRRDRNKPLQLRDLLQNLTFRDGGAPQSCLKKSELLAARAAAVCETSLLALVLLLRRTWKPVAIWRGYRNVVLYDTLLKDRKSQTRSLLRELTTAHRWVAGTWL